MSNWRQKHYRQSNISGVDKLIVNKQVGSDWIHLEMVVNGDNREIIIRDRHQAEILILMLQQVLVEVQ